MSHIGHCLSELPAVSPESKVLILSFFTNWVVHFATELEVAEKYTKHGAKVDLLWCDGLIEACRINPTGDPEKCLECNLRRFQGLNLIPHLNKSEPLGSWIPKESFSIANEMSKSVDTVDKAKGLRYHGQDLGWGALSSTIHETRDLYLESEESKAILKRLTRSAILVYDGISRYLNSNSDYDYIFIFNGRHATARAAYRAAKMHSSATTLLHERGSDIHRYVLVPDLLLHSRESLTGRFKEAWDKESSTETKDRIASAYFTEKRAGQSVGWHSFTDKQLPDHLPEGFTDKTKRITIFNSSEDEWVSIGDQWTNKLYTTQSDAIERIVSDMRTRQPETHIYLRMHPNLLGVNNRDTRRLRSISGENFSLIESDSPISSYDVMLQSDIVLTFGSTMGIEAVFWGTPSVLAGPAMYDQLGGVYIPQNHSELIELLCQDLTPLDSLGAKKFGYHLRTFGVKFELWKPSGFDYGSYKGTKFGDRLICRSSVFLKTGKYFGAQSMAVRTLLMVRFLRPRILPKVRWLGSIPFRAVNKALRIGKRLAYLFKIL